VTAAKARRKKVTDDRGGTKMPVRAVISRQLDDRIRVWAEASGLNRSDSIAFLLAAGLDLYDSVPASVAVGTARVIARARGGRE
jgi:hypothetical protein